MKTHLSFKFRFAFYIGNNSHSYIEILQVVEFQQRVLDVRRMLYLKNE